MDEHRQNGKNIVTESEVAKTSDAIIVETVLRHRPEVQAIYLFGGFGTNDEWPGGDVDIAVLMPPSKAKNAGYLELTDLPLDLEARLGKPTDLVNLRRVNTVLQKEVIAADRRIFTGDRFVADEFEMLVIS